jgi:hypothetical protein
MVLPQLGDLVHRVVAFSVVAFVRGGASPDCEKASPPRRATPGGGGSSLKNNAARPLGSQARPS